MVSACEAIAAAGGAGIPTVKPWNLPLVEEKLQLVKKSGTFAVAMDVDEKICSRPQAANLLKNLLK